MARKLTIRKKNLKPDALYQSRLVTLLINYILKSGKKSIAQRIVYKTLALILKKTGENQILILEKALINVMPKLEIKTKRVGGANYQVPIEIKFYRQTFLAFKWILDGAKDRSNEGIVNNLANELIDASKNIGKAVKKKEIATKMALGNKAFKSLN